jgi:hypothetical protein
MRRFISIQRPNYDQFTLNSELIINESETGINGFTTQRASLERGSPDANCGVRRPNFDWHVAPLLGQGLVHHAY